MVPLSKALSMGVNRLFELKQGSISGKGHYIFRVHSSDGLPIEFIYSFWGLSCSL